MPHSNPRANAAVVGFVEFQQAGRRIVPCSLAIVRKKDLRDARCAQPLAFEREVCDLGSGIEQPQSSIEFQA